MLDGLLVLHRSVLRGLLFLPLFGFGACNGRCPSYDPSHVISIASGTYQGTVREVPRQVVINRQAGTATVTFQSGPQQIVETWKLTPRTPPRY